jgi:hypothetical protein
MFFLMTKKVKFLLLFTLLSFFSCEEKIENENVKKNSQENKTIEIPEEKNNSVHLASGIYENTYIAANDNEISGVFNVDKKLKSCQFYFNGVYDSAENLFKISLRNIKSNETIEGTLETIKDSVKIKSVTNFNLKCPENLQTTGLKLELTKKSNWLKISSVLNKNTEIFEEPDESMGTGIKFKKNELVCILEMKNNWYRVESIGKNTNAGWIKKENIE